MGIGDGGAGGEVDVAGDITAQNILPKIDNNYDLGSGSFRWRDIQMSRHLYISGVISQSDGGYGLSNYFTQNVGIGTTTPIASLQVTGQVINQTGASNVITRGLYVSPNPTGAANTLQAVDYRGLETSAYTLVLASTTATSQIYGSLFNQQTINTTTVATLANASNVYISGAPRSTSNLTITSSTALTILGGTVSTTTNAYGLFLTAPTGATNNYSGVFTGGNFGVGTDDPFRRYACGGAVRGRGREFAAARNAKTALGQTNGRYSGGRYYGWRLYFVFE